MTRKLVPEIIDSLPADSPEARAVRRDLRRINWFMGNYRWILRALEKHAHAPINRIVELGAGGGELATQIFQRWPHLASSYHAIDTVPKPAQWHAQAHWHEADALQAPHLLAEAEGLVANLVLHHFTDAQLASLRTQMPNLRWIIAVEPCRRRLHQWQGRLIYPFIHKATRHDMLASLEAGFRMGDMEAALGLASPEWQCFTEETTFGSCALHGVRS